VRGRGERRPVQGLLGVAVVAMLVMAVVMVAVILDR
jgi:hypothetical protein